MKLNYRNILVILALSILLGFTFNLISSNGLPLIRTETKVELVKNFENLSDVNSEVSLKGISFPQALELFNQSKALFIDARDQWEFSEGHIPGAINIPEFSFEPRDSLVTSLDKTRLYVVYCDGDQCDMSKRLASELIKLGFDKIYIYLGGFNEWKETGSEIESGEKK